MKRLIAMVISVIMLMTMAVIMPVSADNGINLITNGDFETAGATATEIPGWTQEGEYGNKYFEQSTALRTSTTAEPFGTLESTAAVYTVDTAETWAAGRLTQTVTFNEASDYYVYYPAYSYILNMDVYVGSSAYRGWLELTVTGADGTVASQTVNYVYDAGKQWQMNAQSFNITELVGATIGDQAIKSIKIGLTGKGNNQCIAYDNVKLTPVFDATKLPTDTTPNLIKNGDFTVAGESATDIPEWTQEGEYGNKNFEQGTALRTAVGNDPFASLASTAAIYTVNTAETWAAGRLTQTVTFDEDSEYYQQYYAYSYVLSMDVYVGSSAYKGNLELTVTGEDGTVYSQTLQYVYDAEKQWQMNAQSFNISELIADTIGVQPIKSIKIGLTGKGNNQCIAYDNVKLIPSFDENATPPAEEEDDTLNLIVNGSFESVTDGVIANWEQTNPDIPYSVVTTGATKGRNRIYYKNLADNAYPGVKQEIVIDKLAEWYTNQEKYRYMLTFDGLVGGLRPTGIVEVTVTDGDGFKKSAVYAGGTDFGTNLTEYWVMKDFELDLSNIIDAAESKVEKIEITLRNNQYINGEMAWDNVKLTPVYDEDKVVPEKELNLIKNGGFEYVKDGELLIWEQTNADVKYAINTTSATEGLNRIYYKNLADNAYPGVKQEIAIDKSAEWYANQEKYRYMLTFDGLVGGFTPTGIVEVTVTDADGFKKSAVYAGGTDFGLRDTATPWTMASFELDLSNIVDAAESKVEKIEITLRNNQYINGEMAWDNVKLTPVYDENKVVPEKELNLIKNGGFEYVKDGELLIWEQTNADVKYAINTTGATEGLNRIYYKNLADHAYPGVKQEIAIDKSAEWYTNQEKYRYMLTFDGLVGGLTPTGIVEVTVTDADGFKKSAVYAGGTDFGTNLTEYWVMKDFELDLSNIIDAAESKVEKIEITLRNNQYINGEMAWDNVKLAPVFDENKVVEKEINLLKNGGFEYFDENGLLIWEQTNPDVKYNHLKNGDTYNRVSGGEVTKQQTWNNSTEGLYAIHYINYADNASASVKQTVTFGAEDAWFTNQDKHRFMLSFDGLIAGISPSGVVTVTAYDAEGATSIGIFRGGQDYGTDILESEYWAMKSFTLDISSVLDALETNAVKIDIELKTNTHINGEMAWDNAKLTPVYDADKVVPVNLIQNGTFEKDIAGTTEFENWTQTGDTDIVFTVYEEAELGKVARYEVIPGAVAALTQTVTMDTEAEWYKDFRNYRFILSYDSYAPGSAYRGNVKVTVTGENGVTGTAQYDFPYPVETADQWKMNTFTRDLKDFIETSIGVQPVKSIDVVLVGTHPNSGSILYDNVKLYAEYVKPDTAKNYAVNPGFEELEDETLVGWTFSGADQEEVLGMDGAGTEGNNYVALPVGAYADLTLSGEQLPAGAAYLIQFDYKQLGAGGELKIENPAQNNEEMFSVKYGAATGTTENDAVWKTYKDIIVLSEKDTQGVRILLRNTDITNNEYVFYDNIKLTKINGYDMDNLIKNGNFEAAASNGTTSIPGWTHAVSGKPGNLVQTEDDFDLYLPAGMYAVNQTVAIKEYDTASQQNHGYKLEYDAYGNYHKFTLTVTFDGQGTDDFSIPYEITSIRSTEINEDGLYTGPEGEPYDVPVALAKNSYVVVDHNVLTRVEYDLSWLVHMFKNPVKSIKVEFSSLGSTCNIDNVRLICRKNNISVLDGNDNVVTGFATTEDGSYKAKVRCYTAEENAKVYFAIYNKAEDGTLTLKGITIAPLTGDGEEKTAETNLITTDTTQGITIAKVTVWGGANKMDPITKVEID